MTAPPENPVNRDASTSQGDRWTVQRVLDWTVGYLKQHGSETPRLDAEVLLAHSRGCSRIELYTHYDEVLSDAARAVMRDLVKRRANSEPVAYLVGHREFFGLDFRVTPEVLIPRPETETLVLELLDLAKPQGATGGLSARASEAAGQAATEGQAASATGPRILDVGTGSGCIAVAAAVNCPQAVVTATDVSEAALIIARENSERHAVADRIRFLAGHLFEPITKTERFDVIVSNPPYVAEGDWETLPADVRHHEPKSALLAGPDGLSVIRRLIAEAPARLAPGGWLLIEISPEQQKPVTDLMASQGVFTEATMRKDLSGQARLAKARKRP